MYIGELAIDEETSKAEALPTGKAMLKVNGHQEIAPNPHVVPQALAAKSTHRSLKVQNSWLIQPKQLSQRFNRMPVGMGTRFVTPT